MPTTKFSPDTLKSQILPEGGLATNERYQVIFSGDVVNRIDPDSKTNQRLQFLCDNVAIPTKSIAAVDKFIYGISYQMPYRQTFAEVSMSFYVTDEMKEKIFFDNWQKRIVDQDTGDLKFHSNYTCTIEVNKFSKTNSDFINPTYSIRIQGAWPSIVSEIQLNHSGGGEVIRLPVTFQYKKWSVASSGAAGSSSFTAARLNPR